MGDVAPSPAAILAGVRHRNPDVRMCCAKALDHLVDEERFRSRFRGHRTNVAIAAEHCATRLRTSTIALCTVGSVVIAAEGLTKTFRVPPRVMDLLIAATALAHAARFHTRNASDLVGIEHLTTSSDLRESCTRADIQAFRAAARHRDDVAPLLCSRCGQSCRGSSEMSRTSPASHDAAFMPHPVDGMDHTELNTMPTIAKSIDLAILSARANKASATRRNRVPSVPASDDRTNERNGLDDIRR